MNILEKIKDWFVQITLGGITAALIIIWSAISKETKQKLLNYLSIEILLGILLLVTLIALLEGIYIFQHWNKNKLKLKFGVYWNKNLDAFCPICEKPLSLVKLKDTNRTKPKCLNCDKQIPIREGETVLSLEEARSRVS